MQINSIAILENPKAGKGKSHKIATWLNDQLNLRNITSTIFSDGWPNNEDLARFSDCWIIGGDGTINYFINKYPNCKLPLALFNGGTGNDFAWKLYGNISLDSQLELVLNAKPKYIDAGKVNEHLFINCLGIGFDGEIVESMNTIRFLGGVLGYLLAVIYKILRFKESVISVQAGAESWQEKFLLALIVNSSRAGAGFYIAPIAEINDGKLNMVLCKKMPVWKRLWYLPIIKKGKHLHYPFVIHRLGTQFTISSEKILPVQMDGELLHLNQLNVEILANRFLFRY